MAQLVEQLLPIPEVRGSNPVIAKIFIEHLSVLMKDENTEKEAVDDPLKHDQS